MLPEDFLPLLACDPLDPDAIVARANTYVSASLVGHEIIEFLLDLFLPSSGAKQNAGREKVIWKLIEECGASPFFETHTINTMPIGLMMGVLEVLKDRQDKGMPIFTEAGGNVLHHLIESNSVVTLLHLTSTKGDLKTLLHPSWMDAPQSNGKTPLHLLWEREIVDRNQKRSVWRIAHSLMLRGARLDARDASGVRPIDLICTAQRCQPGLFEPTLPGEGNAMREVMAQVQHMTLSQSTPSTTVPTGGVRRM